jgi:uncharacterized membrane protein YczE
LRGGLVVRSAWLVVGLLFCALGIICFLESKLGLSPWDVLHQGLANHTPLSFGEANIVVGVVVLAVAWFLGARIGVGTVANAVLIGGFIAVFEPLRVVRHLATEPVGVRIGLLGIGMALFGIGTALYIGAGMGAGPRDSLMVVGSHRTGARFGVVRATLELGALIAGYLLGGRVGVGTVVFATLIGPTVEASFFLTKRSPLVADEALDTPVPPHLGR